MVGFPLLYPIPLSALSHILLNQIQLECGNFVVAQVQGPDGGEPEINFYHFQWKTSHACPTNGGDDGGDGGDGDGDGDDGPAISGGWIFIIM